MYIKKNFFCNIPYLKIRNFLTLSKYDLICGIISETSTPWIHAVALATLHCSSIHGRELSYTPSQMITIFKDFRSKQTRRSFNKVVMKLICRLGSEVMNTVIL